MPKLTNDIKHKKNSNELPDRTQGKKDQIPQGFLYRASNFLKNLYQVTVSKLLIQFLFLSCSGA